MYSDYLQERGIDARSIAKGAKKTPDFEFVNSGILFLNELKSPELRFNDDLGVYKFKTTHSKLLEFCRTAAQQFEEHDPEHRKPRILTFISSEMQLNLHTLVDAMQGGIPHPAGDWIATFNHTEAYRRWQGTCNLIDGYLWLQLSLEGGRFFQAGYFLLDGSPHEAAVAQLVEALRTVRTGDNDLTVRIRPTRMFD